MCTPFSLKISLSVRLYSLRTLMEYPTAVQLLSLAFEISLRNFLSAANLIVIEVIIRISSVVTYASTRLLTSSVGISVRGANSFPSQKHVFLLHLEQLVV